MVGQRQRKSTKKRPRTTTTTVSNYSYVRSCNYDHHISKRISIAKAKPYLIKSIVETLLRVYEVDDLRKFREPILQLLTAFHMLGHSSWRLVDRLIRKVGLPQEMAIACASRRPSGPDDEDEDEINRKAALAFYMCWRFRSKESTEVEILPHLYKDVVLLICQYTMDIY